MFHFLNAETLRSKLCELSSGLQRDLVTPWLCVGPEAVAVASPEAASSLLSVEGQQLCPFSRLDLSLSKAPLPMPMSRSSASAYDLGWSYFVHILLSVGSK